MPVIALDLHGVLVDRAASAENYKLYLIKMYSHFNIPEKDAIKYHERGLTQFLSAYKSIKANNAIDDDFIKQMAQSDKEWDELMREPIPKYLLTANVRKTIESRYIEQQAGKYRNIIYPDAQKFLEQWKENYFEQYSLIIVSNAHHDHIESVIKGYKPEFAQLIPIYGWEYFRCLKSHPDYFVRLKKLLKKNYPGMEPYYIIGNSYEEMIGGDKNNLMALFVLRGQQVDEQMLKNTFFVVQSLDSLWNLLTTDFIKYNSHEQIKKI